MMEKRIEKGKKINKMTHFLTRAAIVAALYTAVTLVVYPFSFGALQIRISEALTILPFYMPEAVLGLFIGCIISNMFSTNIIILDVIFGSIATLLAAILTYFCRKLGKAGRWIAPIPPIIVNAIIIGLVLALSTTSAGEGSFYTIFLYNALTVGAGQLIACYGLGIPLSYILDKLKDKIKVL